LQFTKHVGVGIANSPAGSWRGIVGVEAEVDEERKRIRREMEIRRSMVVWI